MQDLIQLSDIPAGSLIDIEHPDGMWRAIVKVGETFHSNTKVEIIEYLVADERVKSFFNEASNRGLLGRADWKIRKYDLQLEND